MKKGFRPGLRAELKAVVRPWMRPRLEGLVRHRLYSTWAMVYHMETAARMLLAPYLEPREEAVGAAVEVRHLAAAAPGATVRVTAALSRVRGRRVWVRLAAYDKKRKIGEGVHLQVVMPRERFARLTRDALRRVRAPR